MRVGRTRARHGYSMPLRHASPSRTYVTRSCRRNRAPYQNSMRSGRTTIAAPVRRTRHRDAFEALLELGDARFERAAIRQRLRLQRRPRADLAAARARREIRVGFGRRTAFDTSPSTRTCTCSREQLPVEAQRNLRMRGELRALGAFVVREEAEAVRIDALQQHDARRDATRAHRRSRASSRSARCRRSHAPRRAARRTSPAPLGRVRRILRARSSSFMRRDASTHAGYDRATVDALLDALRLACRHGMRRWSGCRACRRAARARSRAQLARRHAKARGIPIEVLALDDFYLGRRDARRARAQRASAAGDARRARHARCRAVLEHTCARSATHRRADPRASRASTKDATRACRRRAGGA